MNSELRYAGYRKHEILGPRGSEDFPRFWRFGQIQENLFIAVHSSILAHFEAYFETLETADMRGNEQNKQIIFCVSVLMKFMFYG